MNIQFLNKESLQTISGGHLYNKHLIQGLVERGHQESYGCIYDPNVSVAILDSLYMNDFFSSLNGFNGKLIALIHQIPTLKPNAVDFFKRNAYFVVTGSETKLELESL